MRRLLLLVLVGWIAGCASPPAVVRHPAEGPINLGPPPPVPLSAAELRDLESQWPPVDSYLLIPEPEYDPETRVVNARYWAPRSLRPCPDSRVRRVQRPCHGTRRPTYGAPASPGVVVRVRPSRVAGPPVVVLEGR